MDELILHHYPQSPVSEKIRKAMGLKQLAWRAVEQNRLPDRPELAAMTGGYRRLPVMQIGADIFCDTQCIFHELERRVPSPSLFPNQEAGLALALSRWTDDTMFNLAMRVSFAPLAASLPVDLVADRTRLYLGPDGDFRREIADLPHTLSQLRAQLGWLESSLAEAGQGFLFGAKPGLGDVLAWFIIWFLRGRNQQADALLRECPAIAAWADRIDAIGHGQMRPMSAGEALQIARQSQPRPADACLPGDPQSLAPGMHVAIGPLGDTGEAPVIGTVVSAGRDTLAIAHAADACGAVVIHFPRVGYRVTPL